MRGPLSSVQLLFAPYDSGRFDERMGSGPRAFRRAGVAEALRGRGHVVTEMELAPDSAWRSELRTAFELHRAIAKATSATHLRGALPLLLSGNCNASVGMLAALTGSGRHVGLVWMDAHGDFNSTDQDASGFLDGQGLAMAVGRCWQSATSRTPGFRPIAEEDVILIGVRDLTDDQRNVLQNSQISVLAPDAARDAAELTAALTSLAQRVWADPVS